MRKLWIVWAACSFGTAWAAPVAPAEGEPKKPDLHEMIVAHAKVLLQDTAITSSLDDAYPHVPFLDEYDPRIFAALARVPKGEGSLFSLLPGLWEVELKSYCLKAGTFGPDEGSGYLASPLRGPQADAVKGILRDSERHPGLSQQAIQDVLWAIILRARIAQLSPEGQEAAEKLLSRADLERIERSAQARAEEEEKFAREFHDALFGPGGAFAEMPEDLRKQVEAQMLEDNHLANSVQLSHEMLQTFAMLLGDPPKPPEEGAEVPWGAWCYHPEGIFARYFPATYETTPVQLYAPEMHEIRVDAAGRIAGISGGRGYRIETEYDDGILPLAFEGDPGVRGLAFRAVRLTCPDPEDPRKTRRISFEGWGWTLNGMAAGKATALEAGARFAGAQSRYDRAVLRRRDLDRLGKTFDKLVPARGRPAPDLVADVIDLGHYAEALREAVAQAIAEDDPNREAAFEAAGLAYRAWMTYFAAFADGAAPGGSGASASAAPRGSGFTMVNYTAPGVQGRPGVGFEFKILDWIYDRWFKPKPMVKYDPNICLQPVNRSCQRIALSGIKTPGGYKAESYYEVKWRYGWLGYLSFLQPTPTAPISAGGPWLSFLIKFDFLLYSIAGQAIASADPPRPDFRIIAQPQTIDPGPIGAAGWSEARREATQRFARAALDLTARLRAVVVTLDRHGGAVQARDALWAGRQLAALVLLERSAGEGMLDTADRFEAWLSVLRDEGIEDFLVDIEDLRALQKRIAAEGFSKEELATAALLPMTPEEIDACRKLIVSIRPEDVGVSFFAAAEAAIAAARVCGRELMRLPAPDAGRFLPQAK